VTSSAKPSSISCTRAVSPRAHNHTALGTANQTAGNALMQQWPSEREHRHASPERIGSSAMRVVHRCVEKQVTDLHAVESAPSHAIEFRIGCLFHADVIGTRNERSEQQLRRHSGRCSLCDSSAMVSVQLTGRTRHASCSTKRAASSGIRKSHSTLSLICQRRRNKTKHKKKATHAVGNRCNSAIQT
jgi:hypothetical protein